MSSLENIEQTIDFIKQLNGSLELFADHPENLNQLYEKMTLVTKMLYDTASSISLRQGSKLPLGPLPELYVDGFDPEQIWQEIDTRNEPLFKHLRHSVQQLTSFATLRLQEAARALPQPKKARGKKSSAKPVTLDSASDEGGPLESAFFPIPSGANDENAELSQDEDDEYSENENISEEDFEFDSNEDDFDLLNDNDDDDDENDDDDDDDDDISDWDQSDPGEDPFNAEELAKFLEVTDRMDEKLFGDHNDSEESDSDAADTDQDEADAILYGTISKNKKPRHTSQSRSRPASSSQKSDPLDGFADDFDDFDAFDDDSDDDGAVSSDPEDNSKVSRFLSEERKRREEIDQLEAKAVGKKTWQLSGEIGDKGRPLNSILEVDLDFEHATEPAPLITEEYTAALESMIMRRIVERRFDDVVRKTEADLQNQKNKPKVVPELQDTQSQLGLAEEYEKDFMESSKKWEKKDASSEAQKHIALLFKKICTRLDALSNFSYTPQIEIPDELPVAKAPAIQMEEVAPVGTSEAGLLAPEEVFAKTKGQVQAAASELSHEERRAQHRDKKKLRRKELRDQKAAETNVRKGAVGPGNKHAREKAIKDISHARNVDIGKEGVSSVSGSTQLFHQLQKESAEIARQLSSQLDWDHSSSTPSLGYSKKKKQSQSNAHKL